MKYKYLNKTISFKIYNISLAAGNSFQFNFYSFLTDFFGLAYKINKCQDLAQMKKS